MENTENPETTAVEIIIYKSMDGKWTTSGLIGAIGDMIRNGEDVAPIIASLLDEATWAKKYYVDRLAHDALKGNVSRTATEQELGRTTGMADS